MIAAVLRIAVGSEGFILPSMICIMVSLILGRKYIEHDEQKGDRTYAG